MASIGDCVLVRYDIAGRRLFHERLVTAVHSVSRAADAPSPFSVRFRAAFDAHRLEGRSRESTHVNAYRKRGGGHVNLAPWGIHRHTRVA